MRGLRQVLVGLVLLGLGTSSIAQEDRLEKLMEVGSQRIQLAQASQQRIDEVVEETESLESEYKLLTKQLDGLEVYNQYLERQIANQRQVLSDLRESIEQIGTVERQILPLMVRMLDGLEQFVELDLPFLRTERLARVERLRLLMERADVTVAEKFRSLTEAFQVENDFGRSIEIYKDTLLIDGATLEVSVLRLGRIGLYYQTNDASRTGVWDQARKSWAPLESSGARNQVRKGILIARRQVAPDLLLLEIPAPEVAP